MTANQYKHHQLIKIRRTTKTELDKLIKKIEAEQPHLKGIISYNAIILMLLNKDIKISKYRFLKVEGKQ